MVRIVLALSLLVITAAADEALGQYYRGGYGGGYGRGYGLGLAPGYGTVEGSQAAGMGALIQSQGAYNQMTAQAAISAEQAQSLALDNKLKSAQNYYQLQRMNQQARSDQERQRLTNQVPGYEPPKPPQLSASQLDPVTGEIKWVPLLLDDQYQPERDMLQDLFLRRAQNPSSVTYTQVYDVAMKLRNKLDDKITSYATADFFAARHFIDALIQATRYSGFDQTAQAMPGQ